MRHLVDQHCGTIHADSKGENQGATFTVNLPLLTTESIAPTDLNSLSSFLERQATSLDELHILLVEDHQDTRDFLKLILQQSGAKVMAVASVNEAFQSLEQMAPHVLVSDIGMPIEDGYKLIRRIRDRESREGQHIPAIALTAYVRAEDQSKALEAGFEMHVPKPVEPKELVAAVAQITGRVA